jgi:hypothetical protein
VSMWTPEDIERIEHKEVEAFPYDNIVGTTEEMDASLKRQIERQFVTGTEDYKTTLPDDSSVRKALPMAAGLLDYFPGALAAVAEVSRVGNEKHNPGQDLHWARGKSADHADCIVRHLIDRGTKDGEGIRHSAYVAWRALALLQEELEVDGANPGRGSVFPQDTELDQQPKQGGRVFLARALGVHTNKWFRVVDHRIPSPKELYEFKQNYVLRRNEYQSSTKKYNIVEEVR